MASLASLLLKSARPDLAAAVQQPLVRLSPGRLPSVELDCIERSISMVRPQRRHSTWSSSRTISDSRICRSHGRRADAGLGEDRRYVGLSGKGDAISLCVL